MTDIKELRNIHNRYGLAIETEEKAKLILVGDKLKAATERMEAALKKIRWVELDLEFKHYIDVRNEIGKLDDDLISLLNAYLQEVAEVADKIYQENTMLSMRRVMVPREPDMDLSENGTPHLVNEPITTPDLDDDVVSVPVPTPAPAEQAPAPAPQPADTTATLPEPAAPLPNIPTLVAPINPPASPSTPPPPPPLPIIDVNTLTFQQRDEMVTNAYMRTPVGTRSGVEILKTWTKFHKNIPVGISFIKKYCKRLGLKLEGKVGRKGALPVTRSW